ncbi:MAG TPA: ChbG/HpnK family deacetylase [Tepidisphaeraceae bacterium]|nr:ChbG/HpnK family deacetylase [Tepidisphaeraceae bacterium]
MKLIVNGDDFGRSQQINRAIERAHRDGVLNSASLMVAGATAVDAIEIARRNPNLSIGLHLVVVDGPTVLGAPFANRPVRLGLRYQLNQTARQALSREIEAQFETFARSGLPMAHIDGHQHMHMHPAVFDLIVPLAEKFGAQRVRIVRDDLPLALRGNRRRVVSKVASAMVFASLSRRCFRCIRGTSLWSCDRTYGFFQSGTMDEPYVLSVLGQVKPPAEIYFHPTEGERIDSLGPNPTDLRTLLSARIRTAVQTIQAAVLVPASSLDDVSWTHV